MKQLPKFKKDMKMYFVEDQIDTRKMNYLKGGEGGGGQGSDPPWK